MFISKIVKRVTNHVTYKEITTLCNIRINLIRFINLGFFFFLTSAILLVGASPIAQLIKNLPTVLETLVRFQGKEDPLEKG